MAKPRLLVRGTGFAPILAACLLARFAPQHSVVGYLSDGAQDAPVLIRPDAFKALGAIGLPEQRLMAAGAEAVFAWGLDDGVHIPFTDQKLAGRPALQIGEGDYRQLLMQVANDAGLLQDVERPDAIFSTDDNTLHRDQEIQLGTQCLSDLRHLSLVQSTMNTVFSLPVNWSDFAELSELRRLAQKSSTAIQDMSRLIVGGAPTRSLQHRIDAWRAGGRICPFDDDPFTASEWEAALTAKVGDPERLSLFAQRRAK